MAQNEMRATPALPERVRSMEGLGVCTRKAPARGIHTLEIGVNIGQLSGNRLNLEALAEQLEDAGVDVVGSKEVNGDAFLFFKGTNVLWQEVADRSLGQVVVELFVEVLDCIPEVSGAKGAVFADGETISKMFAAPSVSGANRPKVPRESGRLND